MLACALCSWSKTYSPERIIDRLRELRAGGYTTPIAKISGRVGWNCPACGRARWRTQLVYPPGLTEAEARRLTNRYRN